MENQEQSGQIYHDENQKRIKKPWIRTPTKFRITHFLTTGNTKITATVKPITTIKRG